MNSWLAALLTLAAPAAPPASDLALWRLDCGTIVVKDYNAFFSDTFAYPPGKAKELTVSCYLIRNGGRYFLWDTGIAASFVTEPVDNEVQSVRLGSTIPDQLRSIAVDPAQIERIGVSHYHADHTEQAASFPHAKLLIGAADLAALKDGQPHFGVDPVTLAHWTSGKGEVQGVEGNHDVFGDGRVVMLSLPGHTPGHYALLVRLAGGPVLLGGDVYHFAEQVPHRGVPPFNWNRADSLAAMDRFDRIAKNLNAKVIIQHEPGDIAKLPAFPEAAR
jgi:glyoxylase-like metal-dependent hydrolase (beta-lactamase superfamily II)